MSSFSLIVFNLIQCLHLDSMSSFSSDVFITRYAEYFRFFYTAHRFDPCYLVLVLQLLMWLYHADVEQVHGCDLRMLYIP